MNRKKLEQLINLSFDNQISETQKALLDAELLSNPKSRNLYKKMRQTHDLLSQAVHTAFKQSETAGFEQIFSQARDSIDLKPTRSVAFLGWGRFVTGLAAGLVLTVSLFMSQSFLNNKDTPYTVSNPSPITQHNAPSATAQPTAPTPPAAPSKTVVVSPRTPLENLPDGNYRLPNPVVQDVDLYYFIDDAGDEWIIEGYRNSMNNLVVPTTYNGGL